MNFVHDMRLYVEGSYILKSPRGVSTGRKAARGPDGRAGSIAGKLNGQFADSLLTFTHTYVHVPALLAYCRRSNAHVLMHARRARA